MSKHPTKRPPQEHHATLSRMYRQISVDETMREARRKKILEALQVALRELQAEMTT
jgi:hypothetical protein